MKIFRITQLNKNPNLFLRMKQILLFMWKRSRKTIQKIACGIFATGGVAYRCRCGRQWGRNRKAHWPFMQQRDWNLKCLYCRTGRKFISGDIIRYFTRGTWKRTPLILCGGDASGTKLTITCSPHDINMATSNIVNPAAFWKTSAKFIELCRL